MIRKFILWEPGCSAEPDGMLDAVASQSRQVAVSQDAEAIDVDGFPVTTQLAIRRHLAASGTGGEVLLSNGHGVPFLSLATSVTLDDLQLSVRTTNCLRAASIKTVDDLLLWTGPELMELQFFGAKCLQEIKEILEQLGYSLPDSAQSRETWHKNRIPDASGAPLPFVLRFEEFIKDRALEESLHRAGWNFATDLSMHTLAEISSVARLDQENIASLEKSLQKIGIDLPSIVPEWLRQNLVPLRAAFNNEITAFVNSLEIGSPESTLTVSPAVSLYDELQRLIPAKYSAEKRRLLSLLFGLNGKDPMTLDAVARAVTPPLTRERIRQIALPITTALSRKPSEFPWLVRAVRCLEQLAPCKCADAELLLMEEGVSGSLMTVVSILALAKRVNLDTELKVEGENLRTTHTSLSLVEFVRRAAKLSSRWGVAD